MLNEKCLQFKLKLLRLMICVMYIILFKLDVLLILCTVVLTKDVNFW